EYGLTLWAPTLLVLLLKVYPAEASHLMIYCSVGAFAGRIAFAYMSDSIGRCASGGLLGFRAGGMLILAALFHDVFLGTISLFWLLLIGTYFFSSKWRLRYRGSVRRGGVAGKSTHQRHGLGLWVWRRRQGALD